MILFSFASCKSGSFPGFSPRPGPGQSLGMRLTCMMPGMPRITGNDAKLNKSSKSLQSTNMIRFRTKKPLFESHSHFLSVGKPPRLQNPTKKPQNRPVPDLHTVTPHGKIPLPDQMGSRHMPFRKIFRKWDGSHELMWSCD